MLGNVSCFFCRLLTFFNINYFKKLFQKHFQSVKRFGSRSGPTFCRSWSGSKLFAKVIIRRQKMPLARKELTHISLLSFLWYLGKQRRPRSDATFYLIRVSTVCSQNVLLEQKWKKNSPNIPKIWNRLVLLIEIGKFIRLKWVNHFILFYSLDPDGDPLCALLMLDYYAIRSEQYEFLVRLFNEWEVRFLSLVLIYLFSH